MPTAGAHYTGVNHFIETANAAIAAKYKITLNADGSMKVTRDGATLHPKVFFEGRAGTVTDAGHGHRVVFYFVDGTTARGDAQDLINSLLK